VIEFGGAYDAERVRAFHADCAARELPTNCGDGDEP